MVVIVATIRFLVDDFCWQRFIRFLWRQFVLESTIFDLFLQAYGGEDSFSSCWQRDIFYSRRFVFKSTIFAGKEAMTPVAAKGEGAAYYYCERVWVSQCHTPTNPPRAFRAGST